MHLTAIQIFTSDLNATKSFYGGILEFPVIETGEKMVVFRAGTTKLQFIEDAQLPAYYHIAFDIPYNKLEEALEWVGKRVAILPISNDTLISKFPAWNARSFYFYDNNGSILEFICRADNHQTSNAAFTPAAVICASEFGIPVEHVNDFVQQSFSLYGLDLYCKQPPKEDFTVLGTSAGLLIVVSVGRAWYPVDKPAKSFPSVVEFELAGKEHQVVT